MAARTAFLDRDGTINRKARDGGYITSEKDLVLLPRAARAIGRLNEAGIKVIVVTNQRAVSLGLLERRQLAEIHMALARKLARQGGHVDRFYCCVHERGSCTCRKPAPGLLQMAIADDPAIARAPYVMIGDSLSDIQAGSAAGASTVFLSSRPVSSPEQREIGASHVARCLDAAVTWVLQMGAP